MKKLFVSLAVLPCLFAFSSPLNMDNLKCRNLKITAATTLKQLQSTCLIKEQTRYKGQFEVEFINDATGKAVKCDFATNQPNTPVNGCR